MARNIPTLKIITCSAALGLAFWGGRMSSSGENTQSANLKEPTVRPAERAARKNPPRDKGLGAGNQSISSALQLRDMFDRTANNYALRSGTAKERIEKMNAAELSKLVHDLAQQAAITNDYSYRLGIMAACKRWAEIDPDAALSFVLSNKQRTFRNIAVGSVFRGMVAYDPKLALKKLQEIDSPETRNAARLSVLSALATKAPEIWMEEIKDKPQLWQSLNIYSAASQWAKDDPQTAAERLLRLPENLQYQGINSISKAWAVKNPQTALAWANSLKKPQLRGYAISGIASVLAKEDFEGAIAILDSLKPQARKTSLANIFLSLSSTDYDQAIEHAMSISNKADQKIVLRQLLGVDSHRNLDYGGGHSNATPSQLQKLITKLPTSTLRKQALSQLGSKIAIYSEQEANEFIKNYTGSEQGLIQTSIIKTLSRNDPERALKIYQSLPSDQKNYQIYNQLISNIANHDPERSLTLALEAKTPKLQAQQARAAISKLAYNDPAGTASRFGDLPEGPLRESVLSHVASAWAQSDPAAAVRWADGLSEKEQIYTFSAILTGYGKTDPRAAAEVLEKTLTEHSGNPSWKMTGAATVITEAMGQEDPTLASEWINRLPEGEAQTSAIQSLAKIWSHEDIDATADWINGLPNGKTRDSGIIAVINTTSNHDPATAFNWAHSIDSDQERIHRFNSIVYNWKNKNPDAARAAVERADLTDKERERLMKHFE